MSSNHGRFVWYELMTTDTAGAERFYREVVGWNAKPAGVPGVDYTLFTTAGAETAGLMALPQDCGGEARPGWLGYVAVDDVERTADRLDRAGGTVHRAPDDIPGIGRFAIVSDSHGAAFALFRPAGDMQPALPAAGTPGTAGWRELMAGDLDSAFDFYAGLFGWTRGEAVDLGPMGTYQIFAIGGEPAGGMMTRPEWIPAAVWNYYFNVDSIAAANRRVTAAGGKVLMGPHEVPGGSWILQGSDPQGAAFALVGPKD